MGQSSPFSHFLSHPLLKPAPRFFFCSSLSTSVSSPDRQGRYQQTCFGLSPALRTVRVQVPPTQTTVWWVMVAGHRRLPSLQSRAQHWYVWGREGGWHYHSVHSILCSNCLTHLWRLHLCRVQFSIKPWRCETPSNRNLRSNPCVVISGDVVGAPCPIRSCLAIGFQSRETTGSTPIRKPRCFCLFFFCVVAPCV